MKTSIFLITIAILGFLLCTNLYMNLKAIRVFRALRKSGNLQDEQIKTLLCLNKEHEINEYWTTQIMKCQKSDLELKLLQNQTTVKMLQSQMNPHFLYNTLDCIRGEALLLGAEELAAMTKALSSFFSYSISKSGALVTLREELKNVQNYFLIQQFRFHRRFSLHVECDDKDLEIMNNLIPRLTLQPVIENAISHGFASKTDNCVITISVEKTDRRLYVRCQDNGIGMSNSQLEDLMQKLHDNTYDFLQEEEDGKDVHGLGLTNISNRIRLLMGEDYGLQVSSMENVGTDIIICLPRQQKK